MTTPYLESDVLVYIFSEYVSQQQLAQLSTVCKEWNVIITPILYAHPKPRDEQARDALVHTLNARKDLAAMVKNWTMQAVNQRTVEQRRRPGTEGKTTSALDYTALQRICPNLQALKVVQSAVTTTFTNNGSASDYNFDEGLFGRLLTTQNLQGIGWDQLRSLSLTRFGSDELTMSIARSCAHRLEELELVGIANITDVGLSTIARGMSNKITRLGGKPVPPRLKKLVLKSMQNIGDNGVTPLLLAASTSESVKHVSIVGCRSTELTDKSISTLLWTCGERLELLELSDLPQISDAAFDISTYTDFKDDDITVATTPLPTGCSIITMQHEATPHPTMLFRQSRMPTPRLHTLVLHSLPKITSAALSALIPPPPNPGPPLHTLRVSLCEHVESLYPIFSISPMAKSRLRHLTLFGQRIPLHAWRLICSANPYLQRVYLDNVLFVVTPEDLQEMQDERLDAKSPVAQVFLMPSPKSTRIMTPRTPSRIRYNEAQRRRSLRVETFMTPSTPLVTSAVASRLDAQDEVLQATALANYDSEEEEDDDLSPYNYDNPLFDKGQTMEEDDVIVEDILTTVISNLRRIEKLALLVRAVILPAEEAATALSVQPHPGNQIARDPTVIDLDPLNAANMEDASPPASPTGLARRIALQQFRLNFSRDRVDVVWSHCKQLKEVTL